MYFTEGLHLDDFNGMIADYSKAIELDPNNASYYHERGMGKIYKKNYSAAIVDYTKAIEINPELSDAYWWRGNAKRELGQLNSACLDYSKAGELGDQFIYETIREYCK